jgi:probable HAF family extracellular repeat protein
MNALPVVGLSCVALLTTGTARGQTEFFGLGFLDEQFPVSEAEAVSADGSVVVGSSQARPDESNDGFRWTAETGMISIGVLPSELLNAFATDVSDDGNVIVGFSQLADGPQAFRWTPDSGIEGIGPEPEVGWASLAYGVSGDGRVVVGVAGDQAFRWTPENDMVPLPGGSSIASAPSYDGSVIAGQVSGDSSLGALWVGAADPMLLGDLEGGVPYSSAAGLSRDGLAAVGTSSGTGGYQAFWWRSSFGMVPLETPVCGQSNSGASGVSDDGRVVVGWAVNDCQFSAARWTPTDGLRYIQELLLNQGAEGLEGWRLEFASDVSADGTVIVGIGTNPDGNREAWYARVQRPCPADCDLNGDVDLEDWLCFQARFNAAGPGGDCNADGALDLFDYLCFVNQFNAGC